MVTLRQLQYFQKIAQIGSLSKAANELFVSQSSLSIMLNKLETELGTQLFSRFGRNIQLTRAGETYLKYVTEALTALEHGEAALNSFSDKADNVVTFSVSNSFLWSHIIRDFKREYPNYSIRQQNYTVNQFHEIMDSIDTDFVIVGMNDFSLEGLDYRVLWTENVYACISSQNPLAQRESLSLSDLADQPIISLPPTAPFRLYCDMIFKKARVPCNTVIECDYTLRKDLVNDNYGIAITTHSAYDAKFWGDHVSFVRISDDFVKRKLALVWNPHKHFSSAANSFRDFLIEYAKKKKNHMLEGGS